MKKIDLKTLVLISLLGMFLMISFSCRNIGLERDLAKETLPEQPLNEINGTILSSLDTPMNKSLEYQVIIGGDTIDVWKETCYDLPANGGMTDVHTARFTFMPNADVKIICSNTFSTYTLSPIRLDIPVVQSGNELTFNMPEYYNLALAIPGRAPLFLFGAPDLSAYKNGAVIFEEGTHYAPNGQFELQSNTTYYLEEGAILVGKVLIDNATNVKLIGRGLIDDRTSPVPGNFIKVYRSQNIELRGFGIRHAALGWQVDMVNSSHVQVEHLNLLSFGQNNDGLDLGTGCHDVHFEHCFVGSGDDGFGWHATDAAADGEDPLHNCSAKNSIVWKGQVGVGIRIGSSLETSSVEQLHFKDIDLVKMTWGGYAVAIPHSDWAEVKNLIFEGIRDESLTNDRFVLAYIKETENSNVVYRPGSIEDIQFIDCVSSATTAVFEGYDADHMIKNVSFKNVKVGGRDMLQSDIIANAFTANITIEE